MSRRRRRALVVFATAGLSLSGIGLARALDVRVMALQATERGRSDARVVSLRPQLRRLMGYRSFRVVHQEHRQVPWRSATAFLIPGGPVMQIVPRAMRDHAVVMQVVLTDGSRTLVDTDVRLQNRGTMLFGVGEDAPTADGALIIMLRAEE